MTPDLKILTILSAFTAAVSFCAYWTGYAKHQAEVQHLEGELDAAIEALTSIAFIKTQAAPAPSTLRNFAVIQGGAK